MHQMAQEGGLWPSSAIRLRPHWRSSKIKWANIVHAVLDVGTIKLLYLTWLEQSKIQRLTYNLA